MNDFPLAPFLVSLETDGFSFVLRDYERIATVFRCEGTWTKDRLRTVLLSLLVKDREKTDLFLQRFDEFFDLPDGEQNAFSGIDLERALDDLRELAEGGFTVYREEPRLKRFRRLVYPPKDPKIGKRRLQKAVLFVLLLVSVFLFFSQPEPEIPVKPPPAKPMPHVEITEKTVPVKKKEPRMRLYKNVPYIKEIKKVERKAEWKIMAWIAAGLGFVVIAYLIYIWKSTKIPEAKAPEWNDDLPRLFQLGIIGGKPEPLLDSETLDKLAVYMEYFQTEYPDDTLDISASVESTIDRGGIASPIFKRRKQVYAALILEDTFAEAAEWNTIASELAVGLQRRAISVIHGTFDGCPDRFRTTDGRTFWIEDLEDWRKRFLILIFSDGKGLNKRRDAFALETLSRWSMAVWMELREPRFWDESADLPMSFGIQVCQASSQGLVRAMGRFLTERGTLEDSRRHATGRVRVRVGGNIRGNIERILGDAMLWAEACAMIQPVGHGMADTLRLTFHPHLPPERIGRIFALPGTVKTVSGLKFSTPVLSVLRSGFAMRRTEAEQEAVLKFLLKEIRKAEPKDTKSPAYLAWEWQYERVRLELEPEKALKRLAELASPQSLLAPFITAEMANVVLSSEDTSDADRIPLRKKPKARFSRQRLSRIAQKSGANIVESFPVAFVHKVLFCALVFAFLGVTVLSVQEYMIFLNSKVKIILSAKGLKYVPIKIERRNKNGWETVYTSGIESKEKKNDFYREVKVEQTGKYRVSMFDSAMKNRDEISLYLNKTDEDYEIIIEAE